MADWKDQLKSVFEQKETKKQQGDAGLAAQKAKVRQWIEKVARPAPEEAAAEMQKQGRVSSVQNDDENASIVVKHNGELELDYTVAAVIHSNGHYFNLKLR